MTTKPILTLDEDVERPTIKAFGTEHELRLPSEMSMREQHEMRRLQKVGERMASLEDMPTEEQLVEGQEAMLRIIEVICPTMPVDRLTAGQATAILGAYNTHFRPVAPVAVPEMDASGKMTGLKLS